MRLFALISWPYMRRHSLRYALLVAGVALGVGVAVALESGFDSVLTEFRETVELMAGSCQLQVSAGEAGVPDELLERLQQLPEVKAASPVIEALIELGEDNRILVVAVDLVGDAQMRPWLFQSRGRRMKLDPIAFLAQPDSLLLSASYAARRGWGMGSRLKLRTMAGAREFTVRGLLEDSAAERMYGGNLAVMDVYGAQRVFGRGATVDRIEIVLADGVSIERGRAAIGEVTGPGYLAEPPEARGEHFEELIRAYRALQIMGSLFAVLLGLAMIDASFRLAVTERREEIGLLRALGAPRGQVGGMFVLEGLITGLLGSAIGLALGAQFFDLAQRSLQGLFRGSFGGLTEQAHAFQLTPGMAVLALAVGTGVSLLASWLPSREAVRTDPADTFRPAHHQQKLAAFNPGRLIAAALLICAALAMGLQSRWEWMFYCAPAPLFAAIVLAIPAAVLVLVRPLRPLCARLFGFEGVLAADSLLRAPRRTTTTMAVLILIFVQAVVVGGINTSLRQTIEEWVRGTFGADLLLSASANFASQSYRFPPELAQQLRGVPGVASAEPLRSVRAPYRGKPLLLVAADHWRRQGAGAVISANLALKEHLRVGDVLELSAPGGVLRLPIDAMVHDYMDKRGTAFIPLDSYRRYWRDPTVDKFRIVLAPGAAMEDVRRRIRETLGDRYPASLIAQQEVREYVNLGQKRRRLSSLQIQLLVCIAAAALALMNMAAISVVDRSSEFAVLRAIGATRGQLRKTLFVELLVTGSASLVIGLTTGAVLMRYFIAAIARYVIGLELAYRYPVEAVSWLALAVAVASAVALMAALPAIARIRLSTALDAE